MLVHVVLFYLFNHKSNLIVCQHERVRVLLLDNYDDQSYKTGKFMLLFNLLVLTSYL